MVTLHLKGVHSAENETPSCTSTLNVTIHIMLGLPRVRGGSRDSRTYIVVRVVLAIAFNRLYLAYLARWHQHKDQIPLPTPYFLTREVRSHLKFRLRRLPDGELLDQMMVVGAHMIGITLLVVSGVWGLHGSSGYDFR
ncbi:BQ5605_C029g10669 [Microbotryum silenes-dioicae]|uniref:BQ5605_C029g10669 protein n=1 Tax=Microbotryum silenes-dioicae TaxID=796604 RepID=A0A2X0PJ83_9BASI|nr:BQ5605_C029g10669 [Microbotryum silenes-dioicae]